MLESVVLPALFFGLISAASLPAGALLGVRWRPEDKVMAFLLAFGGGALLAALTLDLVASALMKGHFYGLAAGAVMGGLLFKALNRVLNRRGGFLRKPSTAINYWRGKAHQRLEEVLAHLRRLDLMETLLPEDVDKLLSIMLVQEFPAGTYLYRTRDPAGSLYIIEEGEVDLLDPARDLEAFERLSKHDAFGRSSFVTGAPRATEALAVKDLRAFVFPREAFMGLLGTSPRLRSAVEKWIAGPEIARYLHQRHGLTREQVREWVERAIRDLRKSGRFEPPVRGGQPAADPMEVLREADIRGLLDGLAEDDLRRVGDRLILSEARQGHTFFHAGQGADRFYILRTGEVALLETGDHSHRPTPVKPGTAFGLLSFLTEGMHTASAIASQDAEAYALRREDFEDLLGSIPRLQERLLGFLKQQAPDYLKDKQKIDARKAAAWVSHATKSIERGRTFPALVEMTRAETAHGGAPMAIYLGILLDGIPESLVIGANVLMYSQVSLYLLGGLFLSNFPEALSSAAGMKEQGFSVGRIIWMWTSLMVMTGLGAALGAVLLAGAPEALFAIIEGVAAGAMLTVIAETVLPEAFMKGEGVVGISTLLGFLAAIFLNAVG